MQDMMSHAFAGHHGDATKQIIQVWLDANLPVLDSVSAALMSQEEHKVLRELVEAAVEKPEKQRWKCRVLVGWHPTRPG